MRKIDQRGFSALEVILIVVIVCLFGGIGWYVWGINQTGSSNNNTSTTSTTEKTNTLTIKEWGVKLTDPEIPSDATYKIVTNNKYLGPSAFLSTAKLDNSAVCKKYYIDATYPTFQYIERFSPNSKIGLDEGLKQVSLSEAEKQLGGDFKVISGYGYWFRHGNGFTCPDDKDSATFNAYQKAFSTLQSVK